jgi:hypothetical protein
MGKTRPAAPQREIFRQDKLFFRRATVCNTRKNGAVLAEKSLCGGYVFL